MPFLRRKNIRACANAYFNIEVKPIYTENIFTEITRLRAAATATCSRSALGIRRAQNPAVGRADCIAGNEHRLNDSERVVFHDDAIFEGWLARRR